MEDIYFPSHDGVTKIHACIWEPEGEIKGVVQIIHGMCEYASRYSPFAEYLTKQGFLVCADDHLGHGQSVVSENDLGYFNKQRSTDIVIEDIRTLYTTVKERVGDKPFFVLGHSMGSFFCRKYISRYGGDYSGAIVMGSGFKSRATLNFALFFVKLNALFCGWRNRSKLIKKLAFGSYNKKFKPARTQNDWLSVNKENVDIYEADPHCNFSFTNNGYYILFSIIKKACSKKTIAAVPKNLPVFFVAGAADPVGDYGNGVKKAYEKFKKAGVREVSIKLYAPYRHEILNDDCKQEVIDDVLAFIQKHLYENNG